MYSCSYKGHTLAVEDIVTSDDVGGSVPGAEVEGIWTNGSEKLTCFTETAVRAASASGELTCHCCGQRVAYKSGPMKRAHFSHHADAPCPVRRDEDMRPESQLHYHTKRVLAEHLRSLIKQQTFLRGATVEIESRFSSIDRVADVLLTMPLQGSDDTGEQCRRFAFEVQCAPIGTSKLYQRDVDYGRENIAVIWLLTGPKHKLDRQGGNGNSKDRVDRFKMRAAATHLLRSRGEVYYIPTYCSPESLPEARPADLRLEVLSGAGCYYATKLSDTAGVLRPWRTWDEHIARRVRKRTYSIDPIYRFSAPLTAARLTNGRSSSRDHNTSADSKGPEGNLPQDGARSFALIAGSGHSKIVKHWWKSDQLCVQWPAALLPAIEDLQNLERMVRGCAEPRIDSREYTYPDDDGQELPAIIHRFELPEALQLEIPFSWFFGCEAELWQRAVYLSLIWQRTSARYREFFNLPPLRPGEEHIIATGFALQALNRYLPTPTVTQRQAVLEDVLREIDRHAKNVAGSATHGKSPETWSLHVLRHLLVAAFFDQLTRCGILTPCEPNDALAVLEEVHDLFHDIRYMASSSQVNAIWKRWHRLSEVLSETNPSSAQCEYVVRRTDIPPILVNEI